MVQFSEEAIQPPHSSWQHSPVRSPYSLHTPNSLLPLSMLTFPFMLVASSTIFQKIPTSSLSQSTSIHLTLSSSWTPHSLPNPLSSKRQWNLRSSMTMVSTLFFLLLLLLSTITSTPPPHPLIRFTTSFIEFLFRLKTIADAPCAHVSHVSLHQKVSPTLPLPLPRLHLRTQLLIQIQPLPLPPLPPPLFLVQNPLPPPIPNQLLPPPPRMVLGRPGNEGNRYRTIRFGHGPLVLRVQSVAALGSMWSVPQWKWEEEEEVEEMGDGDENKEVVASALKLNINWPLMAVQHRLSTYKTRFSSHLSPLI